MTLRILRPAVVVVGVTVAVLGAAPLAAAAPAARTTVVSGTVTGVDGAPLRGVDVSAVLIDGRTVFPVAGATTARNGTYRFTVQQQAGVQIQFRAAAATGGTSATGYADRCFQGPALCQSDGPELDLTGVASKQISVSLGRAASLGGRVVDSRGRGVGGVPVTAVITSIGVPGQRTSGDYSATTDVNGNWSFGRVDPLGYGIGYGTQFPGLDDRLVDATPSPFGYVQAETSSTVLPGRTVVLAQTLAGGAVVSGTVVDTAGAPVAGADVYPDLQLNDGLPPHVTTDGDGRFTLGPIRSGAVPICVTASGYQDPCAPDGPGNQIQLREFRTTTTVIFLRDAA